MKTEKESRTSVLVLGAAGMLGHAVLRVLGASGRHQIAGSVRTSSVPDFLPRELRDRIITDVDVEDDDLLAGAFDSARPDVVINCVGLVKQLPSGDDPLRAIPLNSLLPHRLAALCAHRGARLIHVSTDCVFAGTRSMYREDDTPDARDLYGRTKLLGEVDYPHALTLRTSIIGHEYGTTHSTTHGVVEWFLAQQGSVKGFTRAVFSGLPTVELARVIRDHAIPRLDLRGVYHVAAAAISKHDLLKLVAAVYGKGITIVPDDAVTIDRSLDATRFRDATGYVAPAWPELIQRMHEFR